MIRLNLQIFFCFALQGPLNHTSWLLSPLTSLSSSDSILEENDGGQQNNPEEEFLECGHEGLQAKMCDGVRVNKLQLQYEEPQVRDRSPILLKKK